MNIIIVGAGEVGRHLAKSLSHQAHNICVIESSPSLAHELDEQLDIQLIRGDGSLVTTLAEANVAECDVYLSLTSDDNTNLVGASLARSLGAHRTIARVHARVQREEWLFDYKSHFSVDYLFSPERLAAYALANHVRNPQGLLVESIARGRIELQQMRITDDSPVVGKTLMELELPSRVRIALLRRHEVDIIPTSQEILEPDDLVTIYGEPLKLAEVLPLLHPGGYLARDINVVIFGGGDYGFSLAQMLEGGKFRVRILEEDEEVCRELSATLQKTVVINGSATSMQQLREEQVGDADFFIAASRDDEENVMTCLQAKSLGTRYCLTLIHRADHADVIMHNRRQLGLLSAVSPRVATSRDLLRFMTSRKYQVMLQLPGGSEVLELPISESSHIAGSLVKDVKWPSGSGLVALLHGQQAVVPSGQDMVQSGDTLYAMVAPQARKDFLNLVLR